MRELGSDRLVYREDVVFEHLLAAKPHAANAYGQQQDELAHRPPHRLRDVLDGLVDLVADLLHQSMAFAPRLALGILALRHCSSLQTGC